MATKAKNQKPQERTLSFGGNTYVQPEMDVDAYLHYLEVRESITETEGKSGLYTAKQFREMIDCIVETYANQFTAAELTDRDNGLSVSQIIVAFVAIDVGVGTQVNRNMEKMQENFLEGK